jgi:hypothetical protein
MLETAEKDGPLVDGSLDTDGAVLGTAEEDGLLAGCPDI